MDVNAAKEELGGRRLRVRKTVGLLIDWISTPYHGEIIGGLQDFCESADLNLTCIVTGRLGSTHENEQCRNVLSDLASGATVDGLVVCAASLQNFSGYDYMRQFLARFDELPMVTLHESFSGIPSVSVDNGAGIRLLMDHLTKEHGYRRFAFLRGLPGNRDFDERYSSWRNYMQENGLPILEDCIFQGAYKPQSGIDAIQSLWSAREQLDALVCANDAMAFGAQEEAARRGWRLPVTGFDDANLAYKASLTTLRQSIASQASLAGSLLLKLMQNETIPLEHNESPLLVVRGSCGCLREGLLHASNACRDPLDGDPAPSLAFPEIKAAFVSEYDLEDLHDVGEKLFSTLDQEKELKVVVTEFPQLGIDACCIALYDDSAAPLTTARLVAAYDGEKVFPISQAGIQFPTLSILPAGILDTRQRRSLMVQALFRGYEQMGFAVFSMSTRKWRTFEILRRELSTALKGASLLQSVLNHADELDRQVKLRTQELVEANTQLKLEILERSRVEAELARREEHYRDLALLLPTMVLELDLNYRFSFINRAGMEMLDLPDKETGRSEPFLAYVHPDDGEYVEEMFCGIVEQRRTASGEFRILTKTKKTVSILFEANYITRNGALKGIRLSGINIGTMFSAAVKPEEVLYSHYHFSPRVKEVLQLMMQGYSSREIAAKLRISENTVKAHVRAIYVEMGVDNRSSLFKVLREYQVHHFGYQSYVFSMLSTLIKA